MIVKNVSRILCCLLVALFCVSMMACSKTTIEESWISEYDSTAVSDNTKDPENSDAGNSDASGDNKGGTTTKKHGKGGTTTTTKNGKTRNMNNTVLRNITVQSGGATNYGDTFRGKNYKMITWAETTTASDKAEIEAFAKQYGCSIKIDTPNFEQVRTTVATKLSSGDAYDIIRLQGSWYPRILIANLMEPLDGAFTTGDCTSGSSNKGIDLEKSKYFGWNNKLYGITTYDDSPIYYMYYNKKLLNGANDPWALIQKNEWTWAKMKELAEQYKGEGGSAYWSDQTWCYKAMVMANNVQLVKESQGDNGGTKLEAYISSNTPFINALKYVQGMNGKGSAGDALYKNSLVLKSDGGSDKLDNLCNGNIVVWPSESNRYQSLYNRIAKKQGAGFGNDVNNLGVAPVPYGPDNSAKVYAAGWLTGFGAGRGSDATAPKLVAALTIYHSEHAYSQADSEAAKAELKAKKQMNDYYKKTNYCDFGYGDADKTLDTILSAIEQECAQGKNIATTLKKYDSQAKTYLKNSLNQQ